MKRFEMRPSGLAPAPSHGLLPMGRVRWHDLAWHTLIVAFAILGFGLLFVHAMASADAELGRGGVSFHSHLQKLAVAVPCLAVGIVLRPRFLRRNALWLYGACVLLLMAVPIIGDERNNARRWIELPKFDLQPSEFAKLGLILALAAVLHRNRLRRVRDWGQPLLLALLPMGLVALQPDLGTALTIVPVTLAMLYLAGARGSVLLRFLLLALLLGATAYHFEIGVRGYQKERIETWLEAVAPADLIEGRRGPGFHAYHARVAIGNGDWLGTGLGNGVANETGILPERESDSIFAVIAEEAGLVGAGGFLFMYGLLVVLLMLGASELRDRFARLVVGGVAVYFASHLFIHVGVNLGLLPMTGLTLPLVSTGGSSMLASFLALGIALGLSANRQATLDQDAFRSY